MIIKILSTLRYFALPLLIVYVVVITALSLVRLNNLPQINTGHDDKIFHALAYLVFVFIVFNYLRKRAVNHALGIAMLSCFIYGIIIEVLQKVLTDHRTFDTFDILANSVGIILGYFIIRRLYKLTLN